MISALIQPVIKQCHSVRLEMQYLDSIRTPSTEKERCVRIGIKIIYTFYYTHQAIDGFAQICIIPELE